VDGVVGDGGSIVPEEVLEEAAHRFALLGDPTRLRVVSCLHHAGELGVGDLAAAVDASVPNVSQHLQRLLMGGVVRRRRAGRAVLYSIADETIAALCSIVCESVTARAQVLKR
jgi:DNA-binding transcriptional ArsR family regulator